VLAVVLPHERGVVLGHFLVRDGAALLREARAQLMVPAYQGFLDEAALRSLVSVQLPEDRKPLAQNFDLAAPLGCAVVDPKTYDKAPLACTFGYRGGAEQLVADLGPGARQPNAGTHLAKLKLEGEDVYVDALGSHVVLATYDDLFGKARAYLQQNVIDRSAQVRGDVEIVAFVADVFELYRSDLEPLLRELSSADGGVPALGQADFDAAVAAWTDYNRHSTEQSLQSVAEMAQVTAYFGLEPFGFVAGGSVIPTAGSRLAAYARAGVGVRVDPALTKSAPRSTFALVSSATRPDAWAMEDSVGTRRALARSWAALTRHDAATGERALEEAVLGWRERYTGHSMFALADLQASPLPGVLVAATLQPGKSSREAFRGMADRLTPEAVLGTEYSRWIDWRFEHGVAEIDGVPVDRIVFEPTAEGRRALEGEMSAEQRTRVDSLLGGLRLVIHRAEASGRVVWTVAPRDEDAFLREVLAAGSASPDPELARLLDARPGIGALFALDVARGIRWLRGFAEFAPELGTLPDALGNDLSDVTVTVEDRADGVFAGELVISQPLLDQAREVAARAAR
jgi:hypothetical protein